MAMSNFAKNAILNHVLTGTVYASPNATLHLALFTADPTADNIIANEVDVVVDDTAYLRQTIIMGASTAPDDGESVNTDVQLFAAVVYGTGATEHNITHVGLYDASTAGNLIFFAPLSAPITRSVGKTLTFDVGVLKVTQDL